MMTIEVYNDYRQDMEERLTKYKILASLKNTKIKDIQFDPNGICNAKCWFCPVAYEKMPPRKNMTIKNVQKILDNIVDERGGVFDKNANHIYTAHYNEIVLYPYFEEMLDSFRERGFKTMVLSNGVGLTEKIIDILKKYEDTISGVCLNIPAIEKEEWKRQAGFKSDKQYERLANNLKYYEEVFPEKVKNRLVSIQMNGVESNSFIENGGNIKKLEKFPAVTDSTLDEQFNLFNQLFPNYYKFKNAGIVDRDELLAKNEIISLNEGNEKYNKREGNEVVGCRNGTDGRFYGWLHINSLGDNFICCQDFHYNSVFGNIIEKSIGEIWYSAEHVNAIYDSQLGSCTNCVFAQWM